MTIKNNNARLSNIDLYPMPGAFDHDYSAKKFPLVE